MLWWDRKLAVVLAVILGAAGAAVGQPVNPTVEGEVALPSVGVEESLPEHPGFIDRIKNPIIEIKPYDPRAECFVYLEGGTTPPEAAAPESAAVVWELGSVSFAVSVLPVVAGSRVEIRNVGKSTFTLAATDGLFPGPPVGPGGVRADVLKVRDKAVVVRSSDSPHVVGRVVGVGTRYFARIARDGTFKIEDVAPGRRAVRIWCRDGWLSAMQTIDVGPKTPKVKITLPDRLAPASGK